MEYKFSQGLNYERNGPPTCSAPDVRFHVEQQLFHLLVCPAQGLSSPGAYTVNLIFAIIYLFFMLRWTYIATITRPIDTFNVRQSVEYPIRKL